MSINRDAENALVKARIDLYILQPFYGILSMRFLLHGDTSIKTLQISHTTISYNPLYVLSLAADYVRSALAHELVHCILDHINRCGNRIPKKWNAACDYVVNAALKQDGFPLKREWLYNPAFEGMTAEHVYNLLPDSDDDGNGPSPDGGWGAQDSMKPGDVSDAAANAAEWKVATVQAAQAAKNQGLLPASMKHVVDEILDNKVDWRERLRRFATERTKNDFSWARPQRRMLPYGYYLPGLHSESMGLIVNAIDTSGSVDDYVLQAFGSEIAAIKSLTRPKKMMNIYCDSRIGKVDTFEEYDSPTFHMLGRGGTDFRPPFKHIEKESLQPACFIYLTDGEGPFPKEPPSYPVLWVITTDVVPPWGEHVKIVV